MFSPYRPYARVAEAIGTTEITVRMMVQRNTRSRPMTPMSPPSQPVFDNFTVGAIWRLIHNQFAAKQIFTVGSLTETLKTAGIIPEATLETSVWRLISEMGFR